MQYLGISIDCCTSKLPKVCTSGMKICDHFILTHGTIVWNLVKEYITKNLNDIYERENFSTLQNTLTQFVIDSKAKFSIVLPMEHFNLGSKNVSKENFIERTDISSPSASCIEASLEHVIVSPLLILDFFQLFSKRKVWKFDKEEKSELKKTRNYFEDIYLSTFLILRIKEGGDLDKCFAEFENLTSYPKKGATVFIDGCPFGFGNARAIFLNSLSKGIISNINHNGNVLLTDARCIVGCEGAPAYSLDQKFGVCGIVLSPFCWHSGEWIGLTFVAALKPLLTYIRGSWKHLTSPMYPVQGCSPDSKPVIAEDGNQELSTTFEALSLKYESRMMESRALLDVVNVMERCIVRIVCGTAVDWGTGIVISGTKGLVVTCAHVTKDAKNKMAVVVFWNGEWQKGFVIYESNSYLKETREKSVKSPLEEEDYDIWDLAIIRLLRQPPYSLPLAKELPSVGTPVLIGGHPLFEINALSSPTFSLGNLAKVCRVPQKSFKFEPNTRKRSSQQLRYCQKKEELEMTTSDLRLNKDFMCSKWHRTTLSDDTIPVSLQTTCAVYSGVSGGPVVALHSLKGPLIIGIVSCCVRETENDVCFPHVNMSIPSFLLAEAVDRFNLTDNLMDFDLLKIKSAAGLSLWKLGNAGTSKL